MSDLSHVPVLVPEDITDPTDLPMGVLDAASNAIDADIIDAIKGRVPGKRYAAMAELAFRWAKMTDPNAKRETYRDYRIDAIAHALGMDREGAEVLDPTKPSDGSSGGSSDEPNGSS